MPSIKHYFKEIFIKWSIVNCLNALAKLQHSYFSCYLQPSYLREQPICEKMIFKKRTLWLRRAARARFWLHSYKQPSSEWNIIFTRVEQLSEIIFALNQLRFRVRESAIYEICAYEMKALGKASTAAIKDAAKNLLWNKNAIPLLELTESIHAFEALTNRVLKVAAKEPIIFLFFIQDLYAMNDELNKLYEKIN